MKSAVLYTCLLFFFTLALGAQTAKDQELLELTKDCKARSMADLESLAQCLVTKATTAEDSVRLLAYWVTQNIAYDAVAFQKGEIVRGADVLKRRKGVCQDYSELFVALCDAVGIECYLVAGYSKGYGHRPGRPFKRPGHAWNIVKVGNDYAFVDLTWASGALKPSGNRLRYVKRFTPSRILAESADFAKDHLPANPAWQLQEDPMSMETFAGLPATDRVLPKQDYLEEINLIAALDPIEQRIRDAERGFAFYPIEFNYKRMLDNYLNAASHWANNVGTKESLEKAQVQLEKVKQIATSNKAFKKWSRVYDGKANKGLAFVRQQLSRL
ncbi:MAG: transglutaminase domain-containing protein [Bacteroidota bacterium]